MISKKLAGLSAAGVGAATAAAALLLGTIPGSAASQPSAIGSAYGIEATGAVPIGRTPQIAAPPGGENQLLKVAGAGVFTVAANGRTSSATAGQVGLAELVHADLIKATCDSGAGAVSILNGTIAGTELPSAPSVDQKVDVSPLLSLVLNRQTSNPDGTRTIDAVVLALAPGAGLNVPIRPTQLDSSKGGLLPDLTMPRDPVTVGDLLGSLRQLSPNPTIPLQNDSGLEVVISSATCGAGGPGVQLPVPGGSPPGEAPAPEAPAPGVVETQLPVTH